MPFSTAKRKLWEAAGYPTNLGSAAVYVPPAAQFTRVYHLCASAHALSNVALGRLKVARGVLIEPGAIFFNRPSVATRSFFRMGYSAIPGSTIEAGVKELMLAAKSDDRSS
jgi:DNA-binding transcriptional MocR family regulator